MTKLVRASLATAAFVLAALSARTVSETKGSAPPPSATEKRWKFLFHVENRTGHEIHVRFLDAGEQLGEIRIAAENVAHKPGFIGHVVGLPLRDGIRDLEVEETDFLKARRVFRVVGFKDHPGLDFRLP